MKKTGAYKIPFGKDGNLHDYPISYPNDHAANSVWVDNYEFEDALQLVGWGRGRSSVKFDMQRSNGKTVSFFIKDFYEMVRYRKMDYGRITGKFTFTKKGTNYGCKLVTAIDLENLGEPAGCPSCGTWTKHLPSCPERKKLCPAKTK